MSTMSTGLLVLLARCTGVSTRGVFALCTEPSPLGERAVFGERCAGGLPGEAAGKTATGFAGCVVSVVGR